MNSTLLDGPCDGACVAFCIAGTTRTFWVASVLQSQRDVLFDGFGAKRRNDLYLLLNDVDRGHKRDKDAPLQASSARLPQLRDFMLPVARILVAKFNVNGNAGFKISQCLKAMSTTEKRAGYSYDWFVRSRPDLRWIRMEFNTMTIDLPKVVRYRDNQFSIWPRELLGATRNNPGCLSAAPTNGTVDGMALDRNRIVKGSPACPVLVRHEYLWSFEYRIWRTSSTLGRKERYFHTMLYTLAVAYLSALERLVEQRWATGKWIAEVLTVNNCLRNVIAMLCSRYANDLLKNDPHANSLRRHTRQQVSGALADLVVLLNRSRSETEEVDPQTTQRALTSAIGFLWNQMDRPKELRMPALDGACRGYWWRYLKHEFKASHMYLSAKPDMPGLYPGHYGECAISR